jgi:hypothetical protein
MIRPLSNQKVYDEHWSGDEAFEQVPSDATPEQIADYNAKLTVATETGNWSGLRVAGSSEPTKFTVRPIPVAAYGKLADLQVSGAGRVEILTLGFRIALVSVSNLDNAKVATVNDERFGKIATLSFLDDAGLTGAVGMRIVSEIGERCLERASTLSPKS